MTSATHKCDQAEIMVIRTAHSGGGGAVRWMYGAFLALCVALAVLVHHETVAPGASRMMGASATPAMNVASTGGAAHAAHVMPGKAAPTTWEASSAHTAAGGGCAEPGMQHCTTASIGSAQLAVPGETGVSLLADLREGTQERTPSGTVGRAPPDLSVLSLLRI
ncbi:hypothetical protein GCM10010095_21370 [Streptomyces anthocyanicus]|uniref:hypothetical protein n=1 Tax=Streptomyces anthocyanicus TaxID=68174 RepID=UPI00199C049E|nr:hypothetical protein [Streptomyces anthocyanicus]GGL35842.1 hypothetical protein GCM10010095_21370 [Streptomyces anthocyanicus]